MKFSESRSQWQATLARRVALHRLLDVVAEREHPVHVVGERRVDAARLLQVLADHVEHVDLVHEGGPVVVLPHRVDDLLQAVAVAGEVLRDASSGRDERHHGDHLGLEAVEDGRRDAGLGRRRARSCARPRGRRTGRVPWPGMRMTYLPPQGRSVAAAHRDDVVVVGDAPAQRLELDVEALPVGDAGDRRLRGQMLHRCHLVHPFVAFVRASRRDHLTLGPGTLDLLDQREARCRRRPGPRRSGRAGR